MKKKDIMFHCMFEQSGTFKNELIKLGYHAKDYDIDNKFNQTDYQVDLFKEIDNAFENRDGLFYEIDKEDYILAFFPCVRFEDQILLWFRGDNYSQRKWSDEKKLEYNLKLHKELDEMYQHIVKLVIVCIRRELKLIIENPYSTQHYLTKYWHLKPSIIDMDRRKRGDYYKKPTQYFFINCEPKNNVINEEIEELEQKSVIKEYGIERSLISPQYANRFIREYILENEK